MRVSLTAEWDEFVSRAVESGRFHSSGEVVREGLRLLHERESFRTYVEQAIKVAESDIRAHRLVTPEAARTRLRRQHERFKKRRAK